MSRKAEIPKILTNQYLSDANMHGADTKKKLQTAPSIEDDVMRATEDVSVPDL